jgi:sialate O-acetylesterase
VKVKTSWDGKTVVARPDANGKWLAEVQTPVAGGPYTVTLDDGQPLTLKDVMVGEVWICSGQSNMEMPMKGFKAQPVEGAAEALMLGEDPQLHFFTVGLNPQLTATDTLKGKWQKAETAAIRQSSATAYFFGKALRAALKVPVGLVVTAYGGSACEAWMAADWLKAFPTVELPKTKADVDKRLQRCPTALYNGMLHPIIGYGMRGVIWYQGEDNVNRYQNYADLLSTMVKGWRSDWRQGDFPFYYCQIAPYDYSLLGWSYNSAFLREQQLKAEKMIPNSRMAVLMDAGLKYGIHPRKKREVGERLALLALANTYGRQGLPDFATYSGVTFQGDTAVVSFDRSKEWVYFDKGEAGQYFEVAGADRIFHPAKAWVERNKVYVKSDSVKAPVAVRYAFHNWVEGDLYHDGLPVSSFRTDDWDK